MNYTNNFNCLKVEQLSDSTSNPLRKYKKKLKQIQELEKKSSSKLSKNEIDKINSKENILAEIRKIETVINNINNNNNNNKKLNKKTANELEKERNAYIEEQRKLKEEKIKQHNLFWEQKTKEKLEKERNAYIEEQRKLKEEKTKENMKREEEENRKSEFNKKDIREACIILNVKKSTLNKEELNKKYKKLSLVNHPDKGGNENKMKEINKSKDLLFNYIGE